MTVAWITGGARGIGHAAALRLAALGHDVAVGYHTRRNAAEETCQAIEAIGRRAVAVGGDVADPEAVAEAHRRIVQTLGPVDILVASHGIYTRSDLAALDLAQWRRTLDVNLTGTFLATQEVLPHMRTNRWGRIVYLGSIKGRTGTGHGADYATTKAGLLGLCRSIAHAVAPEGITVNLIAPGMIDTEMLGADTPEKRAGRERVVPVGRIGTPEDIAATVAYLVSPEAGYVTGTEQRVDGGFDMG